MTSNSSNGLRIFLAPALLLFILAATFAGILAGTRALYLADVTTYHFPMKSAVRQVLSAGELPLWNPLVSGGEPMAANPAYEVFYPLQWLVMLPGFIYGFQLHMVLHLFIAAFGMYALLRSLEVDVWSATAVALSFALGGPLLSLLLRLPFLFSLAWIPLVVLFARRFLITGSRRDFALGALAFALQGLIGEPVTLLSTALLLAGYALFRGRRGGPAQMARDVALTGLLLATGLAAAAVQLIPGADHARDSVRGEPFEFRVVSNWSTPLVRLEELVYPELFRHRLDEAGSPLVRKLYPFRSEPYVADLYFGSLGCVLLIAGIASGVSGWPFIATVLGVSTLLALGDHTPLLGLLYRCGLFRSLRYPEKFILAGLFVATAWSGVVLARLRRGDRRLQRIALAVAGIWTAIPIAVLLLGPNAARDYWTDNAGRGIVLLALLATVRTGRKRLWSVALIAFVLVDLHFLLPRLAATVPAEFFDPPPLAVTAKQTFPGARLFHEAYWDRWEGREPRQYSAFADSGSLWTFYRDGVFPNEAMGWGVPMALESDLDQTNLLASRDFLEAGKKIRDRLGRWPDSLLTMSNVGARATFNPSSSQEPVTLLPVAHHGTVWFATKLVSIRGVDDFVSGVAASPEADIAYVQSPSFVPAPGIIVSSSIRPADLRIDTDAGGPAFLVVAITAHRYWRASIDGREAPLVRTNVGYLGLRVPGGRHAVRLHYWNPLIPGAAGMSLVMLASLVIVAIRARSIPLPLREEPEPVPETVVTKPPARSGGKSSHRKRRRP